MAQLKDDLGNVQNNLSSQYQKYLDAVKNNLSQMPQTQQAISNSSNDVKNQFGQNINPIGIGLGAQVGMQLKPQQQDNTIPKQNDPIIQQPTQIPQQNTQQPTQTVTTQSQQPQFDVAAYINRLAEAKKAQQLNNLQNAYNNNISALDIQKTGIEPKYYDKRNQESVSSQLQAKNFAEYMANRGLTNSGSNAQAELMRNMSLQGNIGSLNRQELQDLNNIETQRTNLTNAYNNDVASSNKGIDAQAMQDLITQYNNDRNRQDQLDQFAKQYGLSLAGLTGKIDGQDTMQKTASDISNYGNMLNNQAHAISNKYADQIAQGNVYAQDLENEYKSLTNKGYSDNQAAQIAYQNAQTKKLQLDNEAQIALNKYAPQMALSKLQEQKYNEAYAKAKADGYDDELAATIGVKKAQASNYNNEASNRDKKTTYDTNKPYYNPNTPKSSYNYKDDSNFQSDYVVAQSNPDSVYKSLKTKDGAQAAVGKYGIDGYKALLSASAPKGTDTQALIQALLGGGN